MLPIYYKECENYENFTQYENVEFYEDFGVFKTGEYYNYLAVNYSDGTIEHYNDSGELAKYCFFKLVPHEK